MNEEDKTPGPALQRGRLTLSPDWASLDAPSLDSQLLDLFELARTFAAPRVSNYPVGVAALGASGQVYLGTNLEFSSASLGLTVHAEQSAIALALNFGESSIERLAVHAAPCGHCRQFLLEIGSDPWIVTPDAEPRRLSALVPEAFGPSALGSEVFALNAGLATEAFAGLSLTEAARVAAERSHAPYSQSNAGVALQLEDGTIVPGSYIESVAFNPSLDPTRAALAVALMAGWPGHRVTAAHLVAGSGSVNHEQMFEAVLAVAGIEGDASTETL